MRQPDRILIAKARRRIDQLKAMDTATGRPGGLGCEKPPTLIRRPWIGRGASAEEPDWKARCRKRDFEVFWGPAEWGSCTSRGTSVPDRLVVHEDDSVVGEDDAQFPGPASTWKPRRWPGCDIRTSCRSYDIGSLAGRPYLSLEFAEAGNLERRGSREQTARGLKNGRRNIAFVLALSGGSWPDKAGASSIATSSLQTFWFAGNWGGER